MLDKFSQKLLKNIQLSLALAKVNFKLKTEGSYLGIIWHFINPLLVFILLLFIFSSLTGQGIDNYPMYLLFGIIIFSFFQQTTSQSARIIRNNKTLIKSINFPRSTLIASVILSDLFSHLVEIIIFALIAISFGLSPWTLFFYPVILIFFALFVGGIALSLSALNVYFTDLENLWSHISRLAWFATPIFYSAQNHPTLLALNKWLNPMYHFLSIPRQLIIYNQPPDIDSILIIIFYTGLSLGIGILIFNKTRNKFPELL